MRHTERNGLTYASRALTCLEGAHREAVSELTNLHTNNTFIVDYTDGGVEWPSLTTSLQSPSSNIINAVYTDGRQPGEGDPWYSFASRVEHDSEPQRYPVMNPASEAGREVEGAPE